MASLTDALPLSHAGSEEGSLWVKATFLKFLKPPRSEWHTNEKCPWSRIWIQWGDLNNKHPNKGNIWITNFHLFAIQMPCNSSFKPSVRQPISQTTYDLNSQILVRYSSHVLYNKFLVPYSSHDLNKEPFKELTILDHSKTELVRYSDLHCIKIPPIQT